MYDNHGLEPLKGCHAILASDGGARWSASNSSFGNWFGLLRRVQDTTDDQVRSLRRGELMALFKAKNANGQPKRVGTYWSIGSRQSSYAQPGQSAKGIAFDPVRAEQLAMLSTRLAGFGARNNADLVNWGYAICDTALQTWYLPGPPPPARIPLP